MCGIAGARKKWEFNSTASQEHVKNRDSVIRPTGARKKCEFYSKASQEHVKNEDPIVRQPKST